MFLLISQKQQNAQTCKTLTNVEKTKSCMILKIDIDVKYT